MGHIKFVSSSVGFWLVSFTIALSLEFLSTYFPAQIFLQRSPFGVDIIPLSSASGCIVVGLILGFIEWLALRSSDFDVQLPAWIVATTIGQFSGWICISVVFVAILASGLVLNVYSFYLAFACASMVSGCCLGTCQRFVIEGDRLTTSRWVSRWIWINIVGMGLGSLVELALTNVLSQLNSVEPTNVLLPSIGAALTFAFLSATMLEVIVNQLKRNHVR